MSGEGEAPHDLSPHEVRVLGCLVEKEATTPDAYPLTLNSLRNACNQSTSRDPVVTYTELELEQALGSLRGRGLTRTVHSTSNRATKFRHVLPDALSLDEAATALLSVLMLRGAQTVGELKTRTERQHRFDSIDDVAGTLAQLAERSDPLVRRLERQPGQKDARWIHLLAPPEPASETMAPARVAGAPITDPYGDATAEFHDLLANDTWESFDLYMLDVLAEVDPAQGPIVDIGSGTGVGLAYLRAAVPGVKLLAIEPSRSKRVALHARLAESDELRLATTVSPTTFADARLPAEASALVMSTALGHLSDDERARMWTYIADRMPVGAPAVIGLLAPDRPIEVPLVKFRELTVGEYTYEGWHAGHPIDDRFMLRVQRNRVVDTDTGESIAQYETSAPWRCDSVEGLRAEITPFGLTMTVHDHYAVVRRPVLES